MELYSHYSGKLGMICFVIWVAMLIKGRNVFRGTASQSNNYWFVFISMLLYSVLGFLEWDTYHYFSIYQQTKETGFGVHFEPFYVWLIQTLPESYLMFRLVVWGIASLLMTLSFKRLNLNSTVLAMTVPLLFLVVLAGTRGVLGLSLMIYSAILFVQSKENRKIVPVLLAVVGIMASTFLHRSMFIFIGGLIIAYIIPFNKRIFIISLIAFPFLYGIAYRYFLDFSYFTQLSEDQAEFISTYQGQENNSYTLNGIIMLVFSKAVLLLLVFDIAIKYFYRKVAVSKSGFLLFKYAYLMIYVSFLFLRADVTNWVSARTMMGGMFGLVICASHCYDLQSVGKKRTLVEQIILIGYVLIVLLRHYLFMSQNWIL